ncbi:MAG: hypothetical protein AAF329_19100 [Cyanobacteria bacterium P01_A01_bin.17]
MWTKVEIGLSLALVILVLGYAVFKQPSSDRNLTISGTSATMQK